MPSGKIDIMKDISSTTGTSFIRSVLTSSISLPVPRYANITKADVYGRFSSTVAIKGSLRYSFDNDDMSDGNSSLNLYDWGDIAGSEAKPERTASILSYIHSKNSNAGKYSGAYKYFGFIRKGTFRTWQCHEFSLSYEYQNPTCLLNVYIEPEKAWGKLIYNDSVDCGLNAQGTFEVTTAQQSHKVTAQPNDGYHFVKWQYSYGLSNIATLSNNNITLAFNDTHLNSFNSVSEY